ncbi:MAG: hypothetical protein M3334_13400 [Actinomycetota bacterium]|nr:hypothetical protein [Actinomycetota bacterium]
MTLLRMILGLIILLILAHIVVFRLDYDPATNEVVAAIYSLGELVEYPARALLREAGFYAVTLAAAAGYLVLYILVGLLRRSLDRADRQT